MVRNEDRDNALSYDIVMRTRGINFYPTSITAVLFEGV